MLDGAIVISLLSMKTDYSENTKYADILLNNERRKITVGWKFEQALESNIYELVLTSMDYDKAVFDFYKKRNDPNSARSTR